jgi:hypothetical protein
MACLAIVQQEQGYVSARASAIADYLGMAPIAVHEVTTFYNMYNQHPVGKFKLNVCTNLPCQLRDGPRRSSTWSTSWASPWARPRADGLFTLQQSECLGACADSPGDAGQRPHHVQLHEQREAGPAHRRPQSRQAKQAMTLPDDAAAQVLPVPGHRRADLLP